MLKLSLSLKRAPAASPSAAAVRGVATAAAFADDDDEAAETAAAAAPAAAAPPAAAAVVSATAGRGGRELGTLLDELKRGVGAGEPSAMIGGETDPKTTNVFVGGLPATATEEVRAAAAVVAAAAAA